MKERDWIVATNFARLSDALAALRGVTAGYDGVTDKQEMLRIQAQLAKWADELVNNPSPRKKPPA